MESILVMSIQNHLPHGCGKAYYADGSLFEGEFT